MSAFYAKRRSRPVAIAVFQCSYDGTECILVQCIPTAELQPRQFVHRHVESASQSQGLQQGRRLLQLPTGVLNVPPKVQICRKEVGHSTLYTDSMLTMCSIIKVV